MVMIITPTTNAPTTPPMTPTGMELFGKGEVGLAGEEVVGLDEGVVGFAGEGVVGLSSGFGSEDGVEGGGRVLVEGILVEDVADVEPVVIAG